jgi:hypothetical protein
MIEKGARVPIADVPEVQALEDLRSEIESFKANNVEVFAAFADLIDRYNSQLEVAEKVVRTRGITCGPLVNYSVRVTVNGEKMYDELGRDDFLAYGGKIEEKTVYVADDKVVERHIAAGDIHPEAANEFRKVSRNYRKPPKLAV